MESQRQLNFEKVPRQNGEFGAHEDGTFNMRATKTDGGFPVMKGLSKMPAGDAICQ